MAHADFLVYSQHCISSKIVTSLSLGSISEIDVPYVAGDLWTKVKEMFLRYNLAGDGLSHTYCIFHICAVLLPSSDRP